MSNHPATLTRARYRGFSSLARPRRLASVLIGSCAMLLLTACGGSQNPGGGGGGPTEPEPFVVLTPDFGSPPSVSLQRGTGTQGADLELEIVANELTNVQTMDFVLVFPGELMAFEGAQAGPFLGGDASLVVSALSGSRLQFLITRVAATGASGSGVVLRVVFRGIGAGTGRIEFEGQEATRPGGVPIDGILWLGGGVEVSP